MEILSQQLAVKRCRFCCQPDHQINRRQACQPQTELLANHALDLVAVDCPFMQEMLAGLPQELSQEIELTTKNKFSGLAGALIATSADPTLLRDLAATEGVLLPIYPLDPQTDSYPLFRMLTERVISINTSAAGGNTTLMNLIL